MNYVVIAVILFGFGMIRYQMDKENERVISTINKIEQSYKKADNAAYDSLEFKEKKNSEYIHDTVQLYKNNNRWLHVAIPYSVVRMLAVSTTTTNDSKSNKDSQDSIRR